MLKINAIVSSITIISGIFLTALSCFYISSFLAIFGLTIVFWGVILYYIKSSNQVPLSFITAVSTSSVDNLNRFLSEIGFTQKGIYLPPNKLLDPESSLVFIPKEPFQPLPESEEITNNIFTSKKEGILLSPIGYGFMRIIEQKLGKSFSKLDLQTFQKQLPRLLVDDLGIVENLEIHAEKNFVTFEMAGNKFTDECNQTQKYPQVHYGVGCILSSTLACALAKVTGKPVTINNEEITDKTTIITYQILEGQ